MSSDTGDKAITELHFQTVENYIAKQIEMQQKASDDLNETMKQTQTSLQQTQVSLQQLATSVNELVIAEKYREEKDQKTKELIAENKKIAQDEIDKINSVIDKNSDGARWANKMAKWIDNYIMKVAVPFTITALIIIIVANTFDLEKWVK